MTVMGYYIVVQSQDITVCEGSNVDLTAIADSGIVPYTYKWYPGGLNGSTVNISPMTNTTYTVTARDCPIVDTLTDSATTHVNVTILPDDKPGFTVSQDSVCKYIQVTVTGLGAGSASSYDWEMPGGNPSSMSNQQSFNVSYATPGNHPIIFDWVSPSNGCVFRDTQYLYINNCVGIEEALSAKGISIYPNPSGGTVTIQSDQLRSDVKAEVYNMMGERIFSLVINAEELRKGYPFHMNSSADGIYLFVLHSDGELMGRRISIIK